MLLLLLACTKTDVVGSDSGLVTEDLDRDDDGWLNDEDCGPDDPTIHPAAEEDCDEVDNDCDEVIDEGVTETSYVDADDDGYGDPEGAVEACGTPAGHVETGNDCDDDDPDSKPGGVEVCDEADNDCDGTVDEGETIDVYPDVDGDGYGDAEVDATATCELPSGMVEDNTDCDDDDAEDFPGATEVCDESDNDCDGTVDEGVTTTFWADTDADGYGDSALGTEACDLPTGYAEVDGDCDDTDADAWPGATEVTADGIDQDCDGGDTCYEDADGDGYAGSTTTASTDLDCVDEGEGETADDCDDSDDETWPGADEYCDDEDDDCDSSIDEGALDADTWYLDDDGDGYGDASATTEDCDQPSDYVSDDTDCDDTDDEVYPGADEYCDDEDDDCDSAIDEGALDADTWYLDDDGDGYGDASTTTEDCDQPSDYTDDDTDCDDTDDEVYPGADEYCDDVDEDCDSTVDEGALDKDTWYADADGDGYGDATSTTEDCDEPSGYTDDDTDCDDSDGDIYPGASESCNADDDDCDSTVDEGVLGTGTDCPAEDCAEVLADNASATDGDYELDAGTYTCDMTIDGGGWTLVGETVSVYGTGYDTTYYNSEGFTWTETLFEYDSGSVHAHCTYPSSLTGCNNLGFQFASESWGVPLNWGSSICGMSTTDYTSNTTYLSGSYNFVIDRSSSTDTVRLGTLEGISSCTTGDNPGTAYTNIWVRQ